ncbi:MAG: SLC13 family permease [Pseudomonadales bacterium]|nr:SLC13 family permease [Pseudomonadales bacterium]
MNTAADNDKSTSQVKIAALLIGPALALLTFWGLEHSGLSTAAATTAGVTLLCVIWWIFEPVPIPATSLLPLSLLPLFGVITQKQASEAYGNSLVLLLLGGFILSTAMENSGAHRRIALGMVRLFGGSSSKRLVFGFMLASAILSMWISNTATVLMLLPVALAILSKTEDPDLAIPLMLGIAFAANLGGMGTPIGTPPNIIFMAIYSETTGKELSFLTWMSWGIPVVLIFLPLMALWLTRNLSHTGDIVLPSVGKWSKEEIRVLLVFICTALLWITRKSPFGGWDEWSGLSYTNDAIVAMLAVVAMFIIPNGKGSTLLTWNTAAKIPWGVLILFGGGMAIATAFGSSGLSTIIGDSLSSIATLHNLVIILLVCLTVTFLTEATSNTATTALLMPLLAATALGAAIDPRLLMIPAAMSASCAFMLPVATAPNAIVFGTGKIPVKIMVREGVALNFMGVAVITTVCYFFFS